MSLSAASVMTRNVVTVQPDDSVMQVAHVLSAHKISAAPVCDRSGKLLGMVSEGDLMRPFGTQRSLARDWWLHLLAEGTELAPAFLDYVRADTHRARDVMVAPVITASEATSLSDLADLLAQHRIKRVPVLRDGKVVGIVSRADLVRTLATKPRVFADPA